MLQGLLNIFSAPRPFDSVPDEILMQILSLTYRYQAVTLSVDRQRGDVPYFQHAS